MAQPAPSRRDLLKSSALTAGILGLGALPAAGQERPGPLAPPDKQPPDLKLPQPPGKVAKWAVVGLGHLALDEVLPAFRQCQRSRLVALVSGHRDKAEQVARAYNVDPKNLYGYDNFDAIRDNPDIDVVLDREAKVAEATVHADEQLDATGACLGLNATLSDFTFKP